MSRHLRPAVHESWLHFDRAFTGLPSPDAACDGAVGNLGTSPGSQQLRPSRGEASSRSGGTGAKQATHLFQPADYRTVLDRLKETAHA